MKVIKVEGNSKLQLGDEILSIKGKPATEQLIKSIHNSDSKYSPLAVKVLRFGKEIQISLTLGFSGIEIELSDSSCLEFREFKTSDISHHKTETISRIEKTKENLGLKADVLDRSSSSTFKSSHLDKSIPTNYLLSRNVLTILNFLEVLVLLTVVIVWVAFSKDIGFLAMLAGLLVIFFITALSFMLRQVMKSMLDLSDTNREILYLMRQKSKN